VTLSFILAITCWSVVAATDFHSAVDLSAAATSSAATVRDPLPRLSVAQLQEVVDELKTRMSISATVAVVIVPGNPRILSVTMPQNADEPFRLVIEDGFFVGLADDELRAAIAHELGHVWVSTHHPYLQTEKLANEIALRVVSRDSLERVYEKARSRSGSAPVLRLDP
jgi:Zn-dependent protease with chaperone function